MYTKEIAWSLRKRAEMTCKRFMITYKHIAIKNNLNKKEAFIIDFISAVRSGETILTPIPTRPKRSVPIR